jgi:hypothetical protein
MRFTNFGLTTLKEIPAEAEIVSHQLMLRAGLIRRLASGLFTWMPLGLRVLRKVENVVREEMDRAGALELVMPAIQPAELWRESGRWDKDRPTKRSSPILRAANYAATGNCQSISIRFKRNSATRSGHASALCARASLL